MAYIDFSANNGVFRVNYTEITNQANNTSTITITGCQFKSTGWHSTIFYGDGIVQINGATLVTLTNDSAHSVYVSALNQFYDINGSSGSRSITVNHNSDGSASMNVTLTGRPGVYESMNMFCSSNLSGNYRYNGSLTATLTKISRQFTLSISAGTGSTITVTRNGLNLSNGATITYGDSLKITFGVSTGYNQGTHTVNNSTFNSGGSYTVTGNVSVISTATLKSFSLSISAGTNTSITVNRTSSPLGKGSTGNLADKATIYYNDVLKITFGVSTGCTLQTHTVNSTVFTSGNNHTVTSAISVISTATVNSYSLSLTIGSYVSVNVNRTSSPMKGASQGYLSNGATIYYGDTLSVTYSVTTGSTLSKATLNGANFSSGISHKVTAAVAVIVQATLNTYAITKQIGTGLSLSIRRTASPNGKGNIGLLTSNTVYYGDKLELTIQVASGYAIESMTINNVQFLNNPHTITVTDSIAIVLISKALGFVHIDSGATVEKYRILIDTGSIYQQYRVMIDTGSAIVPY